MTIREALILHRTGAKMTSKELSRRTGIRYANIRYWETHDCPVPVTACMRIARALGITIGELVADVSLPEVKKEVDAK